MKLDDISIFAFFRGTKLWSAVVAVGAIVPAAYSGLFLADHLAIPMFLWIAELLVGVVALGAYLQQPSHSTKIVGPNNRPLPTGRATWPLFGMIFSFALLFSDLAFSRSGVLRLVDFTEPFYSTGRLSLSSANGDSLPQYDGYDVARILTPQLARRLYDEELDCFFHFDFRKRDRIQELVIDDVIVEVVEYQDAPADLRVVSQTSSAVFPKDYADTILVQIGKRSEPFPWRFHAMYILDDPTEKSVTPWDRMRYVVRDDRQRHVHVKLFCSDPGLYKYRVILRTIPDLGRPHELPIIAESRTHLALDQDTPQSAYPSTSPLADAPAAQGSDRLPPPPPPNTHHPTD